MLFDLKDSLGKWGEQITNNSKNAITIMFMFLALTLNLKSGKKSALGLESQESNKILFSRNILYWPRNLNTEIKILNANFDIFD